MIIIQARLGSTRLPNKVMLPLGSKGKLVIDWVVEACLKTGERVVVAIPDSNKVLGDYLSQRYLYQEGFNIHRHHGDENNVLNRYLVVVNKTYNESLKSETIVRITGDCPLIDPDIIKQIKEEFYQNYRRYGREYTSNTIERTYPKGYDVEVFSSGALRQAACKATEPLDLEHVTPYIRRNFACSSVTQEKDESNLNYCIDTEEDYIRLQEIVKRMEEEGKA